MAVIGGCYLLHLLHGVVSMSDFLSIKVKFSVTDSMPLVWNDLGNNSFAVIELLRKFGGGIIFHLKKIWFLKIIFFIPKSPKISTKSVFYDFYQFLKSFFEKIWFLKNHFFTGAAGGGVSGGGASWAAGRVGLRSVFFICIPDP